MMQRSGPGLVDPLYSSTVEATEEAIINAMLGAETMTGADDRQAWAPPHDQVKAILAKCNRLQRR